MSEQQGRIEPGSLHRLKPINAFTPPQPATATISSFIGREVELAKICDELRNPDVRLLTITGPGGVGKTRLALRAAQLLDGSFSDGIHFVVFAMISDPNRIVQTIADALGFPDSADTDIGKRLKSWLQHRHMLLILDNLEQISGAAPEISQLLKACPHLTILATSRIKLSVYGERVYAVMPLQVADSVSADPSTWPESVKLFVDRALAVDNKFEVTESNLALVSEICNQLNGLPLAIELATAPMRVLSLKEIRNRIFTDATVLASTAQDVPARLRTIHNAIEWSYDLLHTDEQALFRMLSVFVNGFNFDAVIEMLADRCDDLAALELVDKLCSSSLLMYENDADGDRRFRMLQVIREYGLEQLANHNELEQARNRHLSWTLSLVERSEKALMGEKQRIGLQRIDAERDNIAAALNHALSIGDTHAGFRICSGLWLYWNTRGVISEGLHWVNAFLTLPQDDVPATLLARAWFTRGILLSHSGLNEEANESAERSLKYARVQNVPLLLGLSHYLQGLVANKIGNYPVAERALTTTLKHFQAANEHSGQAAVINDLGRTAFLQGNLTLAGERFNCALEISHQFHIPRSIAISLHNLGNLAMAENDFPRAARLHLKSLKLNLENCDDWHIVLPLISLVRIAAEIGNTTLAARLSGVAEALADRPGVSLWDWTIPDDYAQTLEATRRILADDRFQVEIMRGHGISIEQAMDEAVVLTSNDVGDASTISLTPREQDVLRLMLQGLTDREIGEELFISRRTAQTHLASLYKKLGVHTRPDAIAVATRLGFQQT